MRRFRSAALSVLVLVVMLPGCCDIFIETHWQEFQPGQNDLAGKRLYFDWAFPYHDKYVQDTEVLGNDPSDDIAADLSSGSYRIDLGENVISFFGNIYDTVYLGADGTIGMGEPGDNRDFAAFFMRPQVSLLPVDPGGASAGVVSYDLIPDDVLAVTYDGVRAGGAPATAQAEFYLHDDGYGDVALTYTTISPQAAGVIGLADAYGLAEQDVLLGVVNGPCIAPLTYVYMTGTVKAY